LPVFFALRLFGRLRTWFKQIPLFTPRVCLSCSILLFCSFGVAQTGGVSWDGTIADATAKPASGVVVELTANGHVFRTTSDAAGHFAFHGLAAGTYGLSLIDHGQSISLATPLVLSLHPSSASLSLSSQGTVAVAFNTHESNKSGTAKSGGEQLSSNAVS
jgi:hypothetical protein